MDSKKNSQYPTSRFFCRRTSGFKSKRLKVSCNTWQPGVKQKISSWGHGGERQQILYNLKVGGENHFGLIPNSNNKTRYYWWFTTIKDGDGLELAYVVKMPLKVCQFVPRVSPDDPVQTLWQRKAHDSPGRGWIRDELISSTVNPSFPKNLHVGWIAIQQAELK